MPTSFSSCRVGMGTGGLGARVVSAELGVLPRPWRGGVCPARVLGPLSPGRGGGGTLAVPRTPGRTPGARAHSWPRSSAGSCGWGWAGASAWRGVRRSGHPPGVQPRCPGVAGAEPGSPVLATQTLWECSSGHHPVWTAVQSWRAPRMLSLAGRAPTTWKDDGAARAWGRGGGGGTERSRVSWALPGPRGACARPALRPTVAPVVSQRAGDDYSRCDG